MGKAMMTDQWKRFFFGSLMFLSLLLAAFASGFIAMRMAMKRDVSTLPALTGLKLNEASAKVALLGLTLEITKTRKTSEFPPLTVVSQYPVEGTPLKSGQTVSVIISSAVEAVPLPPIVGVSLRIAEMRLSQAGYKLGHACQAHLGSDHPSEILQYSRGISTTQDSQGTIDVLLNEGPEERYFLMPDLAGKDLNAVIAMFETNQIPIQTIRYISNVPGRKGLIVSQDPPAGSRVGYNTPLSLEVNR